MEKLSDQWQTPKWLFDELNAEFHFDIDLCATKENSKCIAYYDDYLNDIASIKGDSEIQQVKLSLLDWGMDTVFMNPPYSNPRPFIEKAWDDARYCRIVALVKADPSTRWWSVFWDYKDVYKEKICRVCKGDGKAKLSTGEEIGHCFLCESQGKYTVLDKEAGPKPGCEVRFFPKRIQFDPPQQLIDSGEVWKVSNRWVKSCIKCKGSGWLREHDTYFDCSCDGKGYIVLSGPTFSSALIIMDRRNL